MLASGSYVFPLACCAHELDRGDPLRSVTSLSVVRVRGLSRSAVLAPRCEGHVCPKGAPVVLASTACKTLSEICVWVRSRMIATVGLVSKLLHRSQSQVFLSYFETEALWTHETLLDN